METYGRLGANAIDFLQLLAKTGAGPQQQTHSYSTAFQHASTALQRTHARTLLADLAAQLRSGDSGPPVTVPPLLAAGN